jgi:hypothetical protein
MRDDVAAELRSSLHEAHDAAVADFSRESGGTATDEVRETIAVDLVKNFGPPAGLAASYRPGPQWLIGPELYPAFIKTLKIVWSVIAALVVLAVVVGSIGEDNVLASIFEDIVFTGLPSDLVSAMGWVVLVFWIIQAVTWRRHDAGGAPGDMLNAHACSRRDDSWDPRQLPEVNDPDRVGRTGLMVEIAIMVALLFLFAVFPGSIGASVSVNGERAWVSLLGPGFLENRQLLYVGFVGVALMNLVLLRANRWTVTTRVVDLVLNCVFIAALVPMVTGGEIVTARATDLVANGWSPEAAGDLSQGAFPLLDTFMRSVFAGIIMIIVAHTLSRGWTLVKQLK